jgi:hypothetical protein
MIKIVLFHLMAHERLAETDLGMIEHLMLGSAVKDVQVGVYGYHG